MNIVIALAYLAGSGHIPVYAGWVNMCVHYLNIKHFMTVYPLPT